MPRSDIINIIILTNKYNDISGRDVMHLNK